MGCLSDCNRYACVVQCTPSPENNRTSKNQQASSGACPSQCYTCNGGTCRQWCSEWNWCGSSNAYRETDRRACIEDVSCSPWTEGNDCVGEGRPGDHGHIENWGEWHDWVPLDYTMDNSDYASCERL